MTDDQEQPVPQNETARQSIAVLPHLYAVNMYDPEYHRDRGSAPASINTQGGKQSRPMPLQKYLLAHLTRAAMGLGGLIMVGVVGLLLLVGLLALAAIQSPEKNSSQTATVSESIVVPAHIERVPHKIKGRIVMREELIAATVRTEQHQVAADATDALWWMGKLLLIVLTVSIGIYYCTQEAASVFRQREQVDTGPLLNRAAVNALSPQETLVRASQSPSVEPSTLLLRSAAQQTPPEQMVRPAMYTPEDRPEQLIRPVNGSN